MSLARTLAAALPDEPRWLETRGMLLSGHATITGGDSVEQGFVAQVLHDAVSAIAVVGRASGPAIAAAVAGTTELTPVITQMADAPHVVAALHAAGHSEWTAARAILHRLTRPLPSLLLAPELEVRLLARADPLEHLPAGLRHEMTHAQDFAPVGAVFAGGRPVSFCYPVWTTERL